MSKVAQETSVDKKGVEVIGYGILVDTNAQATVASFRALNTTYNFLAEASEDWVPKIEFSGTPVVGQPISFEVTNVPQGATIRSTWMVGTDQVSDWDAKTYVPEAIFLGDQLYVTVLGSDANGNPIGWGNASAGVITEGEDSLALVGMGVTIDGEVQVGKTLTANAKWNVTPDEQTYLWFTDEDLLQDKEGPTLLLTADLIGKQISVFVYGEKDGYEDDFQFSDETAPVIAASVEEVDKEQDDNQTTPGKTPSGEHPVTGTSLVGALAAISGLLLAGAGTFFLRRRIASQN